MTIVNAEFQADTKDDILDELVANAQALLGTALDPDEFSVLRSHYDPIAEYIAEQQQELADILDATSVERATGEALDVIGNRIGVSRIGSINATTRVDFISTDDIVADRTIPEGTTVTTADVDGIDFETTEERVLEFIDGFESGGLADYAGSTGSYANVTDVVRTGSNALRANAGGTGTILNEDVSIEDGVTFTVYTEIGGDSVSGFVFGATDTSNYYRVVVDAGANNLDIEVISGGSVSDSASDTSGTVDGVGWNKLEIEWGTDEDITATLFDSGGTETHTATLTEGSKTYSSGLIGFYTAATTDPSYFDDIHLSSVSVPVEALDTGEGTNVSANTLTVLKDAIIGVDEVTNPTAATGGDSEESDTIYRERIQSELSAGTRASVPALISALNQTQGTRSVTVIENDANTTDGDGRPAHSFEAIVDADASVFDDIAETIMFTKAAGTTSVGGFAGTSQTETVTLSNGQTKDIDFSTPAQTQIFYDIDIDVTDEYGGDNDVRNSIVNYTGGTSAAGVSVSGELNVGDDVIYNQIIEAVMSVQGVQDITNLEIGTSASPTGTSNISITVGSTAFTDATDTSDTDVTSTEV